MQAPDCWALAFGDSFSNEQRCLLAGYANGDLRLFDLRTNTLRWQVCAWCAAAHGRDCETDEPMLCVHAG